MKVLILSRGDSVHTQRWVNSLFQKGVDVYLLCLGKVELSEFEIPEEKIISVGFPDFHSASGVKRWLYFAYIPKVKRLIERVKPDIIHAHYATTYGFLGAVSGFHPFVLSVWGSDIYDFPEKSILHKLLVKFSINSADEITSTSHVMADEAKKYLSKNNKSKICVIPFGVDTQIFKPSEKNPESRDFIVIGTVKSLEKKYGIDTLIESFAILRRRYPDLPLKLVIVGDGSEKERLISLAQNLGIFEDVNFVGHVRNRKVPEFLNSFDIFVALSRLESFGVAVVEAMACGKPVVVSNIGGLKEVVEKGVSGLIVPPENPEEAAKAIETLIFNEDLRREMGKNARERVLRLYDWNKNVEMMLSLYQKVLSSTSLKSN
ncbi:MAG: glycosyltransferase family 4 protein [Candidatus Hydrothermia bacterium]